MVLCHGMDVFAAAMARPIRPANGDHSCEAGRGLPCVGKIHAVSLDIDRNEFLSTRPALVWALRMPSEEHDGMTVPRMSTGLSA